MPEMDVRQQHNSHGDHKPLCLWQWCAIVPLRAHSQELFVDCISHGRMNGAHR